MRAILFVFILSLISISVLSQSTKKIKELEKQRKLAIKEIENTTILLNETKKSTVNLLSRINLISEQINTRKKLISLLNQEVDALSQQQTTVEREIVELETNLKSEQQAYAKAIGGIVLKKQNTNKLLFALSGKSLGESFRRIQYLKDYSKWRTDQIESIKGKQKTLKEKKTLLLKSKANKLALLTNREKEQTNLKREEQSHQQEVEDAKKKQVELQGIIQNKQKQADNLNKQIERLIAEEVARQEREARRLAEEKARQEKARKARELAAAEAKRKEREKGQVKEKTSTRQSEREPKMITPTETNESLKLSSNFASNKGRLPMPVTGSYRIIGQFGTHQHDQWNVKTNSSGIDIQARSGAQARCVFDGEVSRVVAFPGYNNCIIVRHGGYYTFYGNIQTISVRQGQKVSAGQTLGSIYVDADTGMSQLHFQLWKGTSKLNPEPWLRK